MTDPLIERKKFAEAIALVLKRTSQDVQDAFKTALREQITQARQRARAAAVFAFEWQCAAEDALAERLSELERAIEAAARGELRDSAGADFEAIVESALDRRIHRLF